MADGGIGEAALIAAAAESAAAAGGTAAAVAAAEAAATAAAAGTAAAGTAAAVAPEAIAAAAPSLALAAPEAAATAAEPLFLGATEAQPLLGAAVDAGVWTAPETSLLGEAATAPTGVPLAGPSGVTVGTEAFGPPTANLFDKLGTWWGQATLGEKLKAGGTLLSGVGTAAKAATPSTPTQGKTSTIKPGTTGKPMGGEHALAAIVDAMLKRRDAYAQGQSGVPIAYRPRGLLG
jgi:hypothetical protein